MKCSVVLYSYTFISCLEHIHNTVTKYPEVSQSIVWFLPVFSLINYKKINIKAVFISLSVSFLSWAETDFELETTGHV